jgi:hypothetical protein
LPYDWGGSKRASALLRTQRLRMVSYEIRLSQTSSGISAAAYFLNYASPPIVQMWHQVHPVCVNSDDIFVIACARVAPRLSKEEDNPPTSRLCGPGDLGLGGPDNLSWGGSRPDHPRGAEHLLAARPQMIRQNGSCRHELPSGFAAQPAGEGGLKSAQSRPLAKTWFSLDDKADLGKL